jgi:hypothetical protein
VYVCVVRQKRFPTFCFLFLCLFLIVFVFLSSVILEIPLRPVLLTHVALLRVTRHWLSSHPFGLMTSVVSAGRFISPRFTTIRKNDTRKSFVIIILVVLHHALFTSHLPFIHIHITAIPNLHPTFLSALVVGSCLGLRSPSVTWNIDIFERIFFSRSAALPLHHRMICLMHHVVFPLHTSEKTSSTSQVVVLFHSIFI